MSRCATPLFQLTRPKRERKERPERFEGELLEKHGRSGFIFDEKEVKLSVRVEFGVPVAKGHESKCKRLFLRPKASHGFEVQMAKKAHSAHAFQSPGMAYLGSFIFLLYWFILQTFLMSSSVVLTQPGGGR